MFDWLKRNRQDMHFGLLDLAEFPPFEKGSVWLVGAGPGAAGLMTLLGYHALGQADAIVYDALVSTEILKFANPSAELIFAGKRGGKPSPKQTDISLRIIELAKSGKRVLRLKGGDPYMFGRGGEEAGALQKAGVPFRIVPGITAGVGGLAYAGIPATHRDTNHAVIFLTGHDETGGVPQSVDWAAIANAAPVIVMYMAVKHLGSISQKLIAAGRPADDKLAIVSKATLADQSVIVASLSEASDLVQRDDIATPAIIVLGPVSDYRETLNWFDDAKRENTFG